MKYEKSLFAIDIMSNDVRAQETIRKGKDKLNQVKKKKKKNLKAEICSSIELLVVSRSLRAILNSAAIYEVSFLLYFPPMFSTRRFIIDQI